MLEDVTEIRDRLRFILFWKNIPWVLSVRCESRSNVDYARHSLTVKSRDRLGDFCAIRYKSHIGSATDLLSMKKLSETFQWCSHSDVPCRPLVKTLPFASAINYINYITPRLMSV